MASRIRILTSGVGLGVHVPGLLLRDRARIDGLDAECLPLERLFPAAIRQRVASTKLPLHRRPRAAIAAQRLVTDQTARVDSGAWSRLRADWDATRPLRLVILSGYWLPLVEQYLHDTSRVPAVDILHIDSVLSPSFVYQAASYDNLRLVARVHWLADGDRGVVSSALRLPAWPPVPWIGRSRRLLAHGGGWGTGNYRAVAVRAAEASNLAVATVLHERTDADARTGSENYLLDSDWNPWDDDDYPPFGRLESDGRVTWMTRSGPHASYRIARQSLAMLSKPGGGTLADSFSSATPVVLADPVGDHERSNAALWTRLGFGVMADKWLSADCDVELLLECHKNLLRAQGGARDICRDIIAGTGAPEARRV